MAWLTRTRGSFDQMFPVDRCGLYFFLFLFFFVLFIFYLWFDRTVALIACLSDNRYVLLMKEIQQDDKKHI